MAKSLSIIDMGSYCVLHRPVFEWHQLLLHPQLTLWWSFLFGYGAHHTKKIHPHPPLTHCGVCQLTQTRATLGCVAPFGRLRSVHESAVESLCQNDLGGEVQGPPFSITGESILGCVFGPNLVIIAEIDIELLCVQSKFTRILIQNGQNDIEGQG